MDDDLSVVVKIILLNLNSLRKKGWCNLMSFTLYNSNSSVVRDNTPLCYIIRSFVISNFLNFVVKYLQMNINNPIPKTGNNKTQTI